MYKKQVLSLMLILWFAVQFSFAESVTFKSTSKIEDGTPLMLTGILTKPEGNGPFPAVVLLHGCSGLEDGKVRNEAWSNRLVKWGYVTFQLDSFGPRNISNICTDDFELFAMSLIRTQDAYDAKVLLTPIELLSWDGRMEVGHHLMLPPDKLSPKMVRPHLRRQLLFIPTAKRF